MIDRSHDLPASLHTRQFGIRLGSIYYGSRPALAAHLPKMRWTDSWLDYLSRDLLLRAIRSAKEVLFPSISEGFDLPPLEAMQLGTPVLASN